MTEENTPSQPLRSSGKEVESNVLLCRGDFWGRGWDRLFEKIDNCDGSYDDLMYAKARADTAYRNSANLA